jgi:hypothetical protein
MTDIEAFLANLGARGIEVTLDGDDLMVGPRDRLTDDDRVAIRAYKLEIVTHVRVQRAETTAPTESSNDSATDGQGDSPVELPKPIVDAVPLGTPSVARVTTDIRETKPIAKPRRKRKRGVRVTRDGIAICRWCDATGEIPHHLATPFWLFWTHDRLAAVLEQMRPDERIAWIAHRCICLIAADNAERILYKSGGLWSTEPDLGAIVDGGVVVISGALPEIPRHETKSGDNGSGKRGFLVSLTGAIACCRCGEQGQHGLTLIFTTLRTRPQLSALLEQMRLAEHLSWIEHQRVRLQATDGTERTLHERNDTGREKPAKVPELDPVANSAAHPTIISRGQYQAPQGFENLIATVRSRCDYWLEQAAPAVRPHLEALIRESEPVIAELREQQDFDGLRDCLIKLQRDIGDALARHKSPATSSTTSANTATTSQPAQQTLNLRALDRHGCPNGSVPRK